MENSLHDPIQETVPPTVPEHEPHESPVRRYYQVYGALMVLLVLTVAVAQFHWGAFGIVMAMLIAVTKAGLVLIYFMHLRQGTRLTWLFAASGFVWLVILIAFILVDYLTRGWIGQ